MAELDEVEPVAPVIVTPDLVPTADQDEPVATYLDYDKAKTRVITYAIGSQYPGIYAETMAIAKFHCKRNYGTILEVNTVPGRAFFRVKA